jgi:hypothetical protein
MLLEALMRRRFDVPAGLESYRFPDCWSLIAAAVDLREYPPGSWRVAQSRRRSAACCLCPAGELRLADFRRWAIRRHDIATPKRGRVRATSC